MANNGYRPFHETELSGLYKELNTRDLAVGDKLVRVIKRGGSWNSPIERREEEVTVTKVLTSRLVVENDRGQAFRVLVQNSKSWPAGNGKVSTDVEGNSTSYSRNAFLLYTPEDPFLEEGRTDAEAHNETLRIKHSAGRKAEAAWRNLNVQTAEDAIVALQAYVLFNKTEG